MRCFALCFLVLAACDAGPEEQVPVDNAFGQALSVVPVSDHPRNPPATRTPLGTNGRFCNVCHGATIGWGLTPSANRARFDQSPDNRNHSFDVGGTANAAATTNDALDPLFRPIDGAGNPSADLSTPDARSRAYALLLSRAVIRVALPMPQQAEFSLGAVDDPYGHASSAELSLFRRTLPMTNLRFVTTVMWDGRETAHGEALEAALRQQAIDATLSHAQASSAPASDVLDAIVGEELGSIFAQRVHKDAGDLRANGGRGGPAVLSSQAFHVGINSGASFDPHVFDLFDAWKNDSNPARAAIARGQTIFNERHFTIRGVSGLNDESGEAAIAATCGTCHNAPNVGGSSEGKLFDIGISNESRRTPDLPLYTFTGTSETRRLTDPGQGLITGKWAHLGRFKVPGLRGLAAHPPYFHDGSAASIADVVDYVDARFAIGLGAGDKTDLVTFLGAL
jgi:hypothetical protein